MSRPFTHSTPQTSTSVTEAGRKPASAQLAGMARHPPPTAVPATRASAAKKVDEEGVDVDGIVETEEEATAMGAAVCRLRCAKECDGPLSRFIVRARSSTLSDSLADTRGGGVGH
jgi:hypothetical protein